MFTNYQRQEERTGKTGTPRLQCLQELVSQFQNATDEQTKERIVANLANFSYDPYTTTPSYVRAAKRTTLHDLYEKEGQSPWYDNLCRPVIDLLPFIARGVRGVTSNPAATL